MNSEEGILLTQFLKVFAKVLNYDHMNCDKKYFPSLSRTVFEIDLIQAIPAIYPLLAAEWGIFGPFILFARSKITVHLAKRPAPVAVQWLHLDDIGAVLRQQHGSVGPGDALGGIEHFNTVKRFAVGHEFCP